MSPWVINNVENKEKLKEMVIKLYEDQWRIIKMKMTIYSVQDVLTGFAQPFLFDTDDIAKRAYEDFLKIDKHPEDKRLFKLGTMDTENGNIVAEYVPECIQGGGFINEQSEV